MVERFDVVVVGARLAGCAVAAPLARAGRRVLVLDRMPFPSDQLSTHVLLPAGTSELASIGALPRILRLKPSRVRYVEVQAEGIACRERLRPAADGIDYGVCVPRDLQDVELVEAVREQGAEVRERCAVEGLRWRAGRVAGVRYRTRGRRRAGGGGHAGHRRRRPPLDRRLAGRRLDAVPDLAQRARPRLPLPRGPARGRRRGRDLLPVARGRLVRVRLPDDAGGQAARAADGPPRRGERGAARPRGLLARQARRASGPRCPDRRGAARLEAPLDGGHAGVLPRVLGPRMGARGRRRALQGPRHRPGHARRDVRGPDARRAGPPGARRPGRGRPRDTRLGGRSATASACPPTTSRTPTRAWSGRLPRCASSCATRAGPSDAGPRRPVRPCPHAAADRAAAPPRRAPSRSALARGERPRPETLARGAAELRTELEIRRELRAGRFRSTRRVRGSEHPGAAWPAPPAEPPAPAASAQKPRVAPAEVPA